MSKYTAEELEARIRALIPSMAVLDRSSEADGDDLLDSTKDRVARLLYSRVEIPYYLAQVAGNKLSTYLTELTDALAVIERCTQATQIDDTASFVDYDEIQRAVTATMELPAATVQSQANLLSTQLFKYGKQYGSVAYGRTQALPVLEQYLAVVSSLLPTIDFTLSNITNLLDNIDEADLLAWTLRRQLRLLSKLSSQTEQTPVPAVDVLAAAALMDKSFLRIDFAADKYTGSISPVVGVANRYTLTGDLPAEQFEILPGDIVRRVAGGTAVAHSSKSNLLYLRSSPGWATSDVVVSSGLRAAYLSTRKELLNLGTTAEKAGKDFTSRARTYALGNTGLAQYRASYTALSSFASAASTALTALLAAQEGVFQDVVSFIESLREERLFAVINYLEHCDFAGIAGVSYDNVSAPSSAAELLLQLSTALGADTSDIELLDISYQPDDYNDRAR